MTNRSGEGVALGAWATVIILIGVGVIVLALVFGVINRPTAADDIGDMPEENPDDPSDAGHTDRTDRDTTGNTAGDDAGGGADGP